VHKLAAWIGNDLVGHLDFNVASGLFAFDYTTSWQALSYSFPLSPCLPFTRTNEDAIHSRSVRVFFENLLPEGNALDAAATANGLSKNNLFGLVRALGRETTGALTLRPEGEFFESNSAPLREITRDELSKRIRERDVAPFSVWDGKVRLSIAGLQDKVAVYMRDGRMFLAEGANIASTHILKPMPQREVLSSLVANEFFCMKLAAAIGLTVADVEIIRVPEPVLLVRRFDRKVTATGVSRKHIIDACQALDLPPEYKYEKNYGSGKDVRHIRDGVSYSKLFRLDAQTVQPAVFNMAMLRWALFQYLIGNSDAHGKNMSFYVSHDGIHPAPAYDLVSVMAYQDFENELAMGIGDAFTFEDALAFQWADFAHQCRINKTLLAREMRRMATATIKAVTILPDDTFTSEEQVLIFKVRNFILSQCDKLLQVASRLRDIKEDFL